MARRSAAPPRTRARAVPEEASASRALGPPSPVFRLRRRLGSPGTALPRRDARRRPHGLPALVEREPPLDVGGERLVTVAPGEEEGLSGGGRGVFEPPARGVRGTERVEQAGVVVAGGVARALGERDRVARVFRS